MKKVHFSIYVFLFILFSTPFWASQISSSVGNNFVYPNLEDSLNTVIGKDSLTNANDTTISDTLTKKKDGLDAPVDYAAKDSIVFTVGNWGYLYGESKVDYQNMGIQAENISMNMDSSIVHATFGLDSIGKEFGYPIFKNDNSEYEMKNVSYNFKTRKGYSRNTITQEGDGYIVADKAKRNADGSFFVCDGKYTTCDHHDHPHFYLMLTKAKVRPGKDVISGPAYLVIEDLPLPLAIPFGFMPFSQSYSSGILMPSIGDDMDRGFNLRNGGYYFALSEYIDLALTGEIYTKGSWGLAARSNYRKRYRYSGSFNASYLYTKYGDRYVPETFNEAKDFSLTWSHTQDPKANMYRTLSANVNYRTSSYNRYNQEALYGNNSTDNTRSSTVTLTQRFPNSPFTLSANVSASQRTKDSTIALTLPNLTVNMSRIYPFKRKQAVGAEKWYEKIQFSYSGDLRNSITIRSDSLFKVGMDRWKTGMKHTIPISATFSLFNYLNVTPSLTYSERWYTRKILQKWDSESMRHVDGETINEFGRAYDFNFNVALQTKLYGFYEPIFKIGKLQKIRHVFTPQITFGGNPDFGDPRFGAYKTYEYLDADGIMRTETYSPYRYEIFGPPSRGKQGGIGFNFDNNVEMKVGTDNDSTKIVSLIDNLNVNFSYNMMADSLKWSDINTSLRLKLGKNLTVNLNATFDPYTYTWDEKNQRGIRVDKLRISEGKGIGRLSRTGYSISPSINQDTFKKFFGKGKKGSSDVENKNENSSDEDDDEAADKPRKSLFEKEDDHGEYDADGYLKNEIKWNLNFNYSMSYGYDYSDFDEYNLEYKRKLTHNLSFSGAIQPTKNWSFNFNSSYDVEKREIVYMNCTLSRNLHCWTLSASFIPIGPYTSYYVSLRVNSSVLQDLKYEQRSRQSSYDPQWY